MTDELSKRQQKRLRRRELLASQPLRGTRIRASDGVRLCIKHGKRWYRTEGDGQRVRGELIRAGTHDPGLEVYPCGSSKGWHLGHPSGWKSLERLVDEQAAS